MDKNSPTNYLPPIRDSRDRKSTRLNSSHLVISYAVFCLKKKINRMAETPDGTCHITGPRRTPNDTLGRAVPIPALRGGYLIGGLRSAGFPPTASPVLFLAH